MSVLALDLSDRALSVARDARVLVTRPSVVFDGSTPEGPGAPAWQALRRAPTAISTRHLAHVLGGSTSARATALLTAELWRLLQETPQPDRPPAPQPGSLGPEGPAGPEEAENALWITTPAQATPHGLSSLLGVARTLGLNVDGFVDAAALQAAALALPQPALVLELGLHHLAASLVERSGGFYLARRTVADGSGGWLELLGQLAQLVGRTVVQQTRFDPLHEAASEQLLYDGLPDLLAQVAAEGSASLTSLPAAAAVMISRDQLAQASQGLRREVLRLLHGLRPAGLPLCILVPAALLTVPGLAEDLEAFSGCELICLQPGFAAQALSSVALPARQPEEPVRLLRRVPAAVAADTAALAAGVERRALGARRAAAQPPSHVLWNGEAYPLMALTAASTAVSATSSRGTSTVALVVGCEPGEGGAQGVLRLGPGLAGISRRHCSFLIAPGEVVLLDHSRFGTFVNGERVAERVRVHAGDRVRLGDPGVELSLIAVPAPGIAGSTAPAGQPPLASS